MRWKSILKRLEKEIVIKMKMTQEYDGSICIHNQIVGKFEIDGFTPEQNQALNDEIVKRWNAFEDAEPTEVK